MHEHVPVQVRVAMCAWVRVYIWLKTFMVCTLYTVHKLLLDLNINCIVQSVYHIILIIARDQEDDSH